MNKKLLIVVVTIVAAIGIVAGLAIPKLLPGKDGKKPEKEAVKTRLVTMEEFLVNLADAGDPHYLKVAVVLDVVDDGKGESGGGEGEGKGSGDPPKLRDAMITTMSRRSFHELLTPSGKTHLKEALKAAANRVGSGPKVVNVYFTSFAMQ